MSILLCLRKSVAFCATPKLCSRALGRTCNSWSAGLAVPWEVQDYIASLDLWYQGSCQGFSRPSETVIKDLPWCTVAGETMDSKALKQSAASKVHALISVLPPSPIVHNCFSCISLQVLSTEDCPQFQTFELSVKLRHRPFEKGENITISIQILRVSRKLSKRGAFKEVPLIATWELKLSIKP